MHNLVAIWLHGSPIVALLPTTKKIAEHFFSDFVAVVIGIRYQVYTEILEVILFAFAYRLFPEDFSPI